LNGDNRVVAIAVHDVESRSTLTVGVRDDALRMLDDVAQHDWVPTISAADGDDDDIILGVELEVRQGEHLRLCFVPELLVEQLDGDLVSFMLFGEVFEPSLPLGRR